LIQNEPLPKIHALSLTNSSDVVFWVLKKKAKFLPNLYIIKWLEKYLAGANYMWIFSAKLPLKIKTYMWKLFQNDVLARENITIYVIMQHEFLYTL
jgi:hypothetical protein